MYVNVHVNDRNGLLLEQSFPLFFSPQGTCICHLWNLQLSTTSTLLLGYQHHGFNTRRWRKRTRNEIRNVDLSSCPIRFSRCIQHRKSRWGQMGIWWWAEVAWNFIDVPTYFFLGHDFVAAQMEEQTTHTTVGVFFACACRTVWRALIVCQKFPFASQVAINHELK